MKKLFLLLTAVLMAVVCALAQTHTITGTVVSAADGEPLAGATVMPVGGGVQGTATDIDGKFTISLPANVKKVVVSYVGMVSQTVDAKDGMTVALTENENSLDEVMVVAYGTAKKSAYTGSASVIKADDIEGRMVTDAVSALSGAMSGVQVTTANGQPGTAPTVRIRGIGTIFGTSTPLYVVDGMPFDGDIATLNTMDVESMTVLKDAAAAALYGARGANGVILITTKKGKEGDAKVTLDARWGSNARQIHGYDVIKDPRMYYETAYSALYNGFMSRGASAVDANLQANAMLTGSNGEWAMGRQYNIFNVPAGQLLIGQNGKVNPNATIGRITPAGNLITPDDWYDETFIHGLRQEYNLSVSGGTERFQFYGSVGYLSDEGIIKGSQYQRLSARIGADYQAKKWLKIGTSIAYNYVNMNSPSGQESDDFNSSANAFAIVDKMAPIYPMYVRDAAGNKVYDNTSGLPIYDYGDGRFVNGTYRNYMAGANPTSNFLYDKSESLMDVLDAKWFATITPIENLNVTGTIGYFLDNTRHHTINNPFYGSMVLQKGSASQVQSRLRGLNIQALANYRRTFGDVHHASIMVGYESYERNSETVQASGVNLYNPNSWAVNNTLDNSMRKGYGASAGYATRGIFGRVNYDYDSRYFVEASYRRDASSNFAPEHRWGNFFSASLGWDAAKERFLQDQDWIDMLKVKASYGQQGNDNLGLIAPYYEDIYVIEGSEAWSDGNLTQKGNRDLTWETSNAWNAGVDFSFFKERLSGTFEYFLRQTSDMLYNRPVAPTAGYPSIPMNIGSLRNSGIEIEITGRPIVTRDIVWELNFNGTWLKNRILKLHPEVGGRLISGMYVYAEGESVRNMLLARYAGVDPATGAALYWATDENGVDYKTDNYDVANTLENRRTTGNLMPTFYGGFGTTLNLYGIDLSVQFSYQLGGRMYDEGYAQLMHSGKTGSLGTNWHADALKQWTPENTNTNIPQLNTQNTYNFGDNRSDFFLVSSNYLSLQNITLGYTLPKKWTKAIYLDNVRIYGAADNVALWSRRKGLDPRMAAGGGVSQQQGAYSLIRNISGGIRVTF